MLEITNPLKLGQDATYVAGELEGLEELAEVVEVEVVVTTAIANAPD